MDRPPQQHDLPVPSALDSPFHSESAVDARANVEIIETGSWSDPWGLDLQQSPEAPNRPASTQDIREVFLRRSGDTSSADVSASGRAKWLTIASRVWARIQPRFPLDRRVAAGLGLVSVAGVLLVGLSRYDVARSIRSVSGTTYNTAVEGLASAVGGARDLVGKRPASAVTTADVAAISRSKVPSVRPTGKRVPRNSSRAIQPTPLLSIETVQANAPAPIGNADVKATVETRTAEALALQPDDSAIETLILHWPTDTVYSPDDTDVSPPVAIRSPGIAMDRGGSGEKNPSVIEILVSETGLVESVRARQRPATLAAALQSNTALSVVKLWRFRPARRNGQPVKYRTTLPFGEILNPAGTNDGTR